MCSFVNFKIHAILKGYHVNRVKPPVGTICTVQRIQNDKFEDVYSVVYDGKTVGHVPAYPVKLNKAIDDILSIDNSFQFNW